MPSFLTSYGVIYGSAIVPAANAIHDKNPHWLKYFIAFALTNSFLKLGTVKFVLAYTPFSTHIVLAFYLYMQQRKWGGAEILYFLLVNELVGFGVISSGEGTGGKARSFSQNMSITGRVKRCMSGTKKIETEDTTKIIIKEEKKEFSSSENENNRKKTQ